MLNNQKEDSSLLNVQTEIQEPCAQSASLISHKNDEEKQKTGFCKYIFFMNSISFSILYYRFFLDNILRPRSPIDQKEQISIPEIITKSKSPNAQNEQFISSTLTSTDMNDFQPNSINHSKEQDKNQTEQNKKQGELIKNLFV